MFELLRPAGDQMHRQSRRTARILDTYWTPKAASELTLKRRRQVADVAVDHPEQRDDRGLVRGDRIEITH